MQILAVRCGQKFFLNVIVFNASIIILAVRLGQKELPQSFRSPQCTNGLVVRTRGACGLVIGEGTSYGLFVRAGTSCGLVICVGTIVRVLRAGTWCGLSMHAGSS
ncbi:hypothetical protein AMTR_s00085p00118820 [Amborella trichopoda]|uniref:Uncharacterized protein n=1 Tax=Amborella trichopoda TaxID=13333 RepID=W1NYN4_AMBTC|nr:hypothetical protein AMTR_s00085p00118820 [Amborella trichopoda]